MIKRLFDLALSGVGLIISAPLWAVITAAVKIEDRFPLSLQTANALHLNPPPRMILDLDLNLAERAIRVYADRIDQIRAI